MPMEIMHSGEIHGISFIKAVRLPKQICHGFEAHQERYCFIIYQLLLLLLLLLPFMEGS